MDVSQNLGIQNRIKLCMLHALSKILVPELLTQSANSFALDEEWTICLYERLWNYTYASRLNELP